MSATNNLFVVPDARQEIWMFRESVWCLPHAYTDRTVRTPMNLIRVWQWCISSLRLYRMSSHIRAEAIDRDLATFAASCGLNLGSCCLGVVRFFSGVCVFVCFSRRYLKNRCSYMTNKTSHRNVPPWVLGSRNPFILVVTRSKVKVTKHKLRALLGFRTLVALTSSNLVRIGLSHR